MAYQQIAGEGPLFPGIRLTALPSLSNSGPLLIDATGEKIALIGRVWFPARTGSKNITRVGFRFGTVVKAGGSGLTVSLQDVDLSNGPPGQPDGVQDQTVAIANGDASFASSTWHRTGTLNVDRTVSYGDRLAVVVEYDGGGRLGSDSVTVSTVGLATGAHVSLTCHGSLFTASWAVQTGQPDVVLEFDDGTFGTLRGAFIATAVTTHNFNLNTAGSDEYALAFSLPFPCKVDGLWAFVSVANGSADFELILYDGTTALATCAVDANTCAAAGSARPTFEPIPEQELLANTTYYVAIRPTTANNVSAVSFDVADADHFQAMEGGPSFNFSTRLNQGAWAAATATRRLLAGVSISQIHDGAGGGGGGFPSQGIQHLEAGVCAG